jgi:hypothetical protein
MAKRHKDLREQVLSLATVPSPPFDHLVSNHKFAAALARIRYLAAPGMLPPDLDGQAKYWWHNYNGCSPGGHGPKAYLQAWATYCAKLYNGKSPPPTTPPANTINPPPLLPGLIIC